MRNGEDKEVVDLVRYKNNLDKDGLMQIIFSVGSLFGLDKAKDMDQDELFFAYSFYSKQLENKTI